MIRPYSEKDLDDVVQVWLSASLQAHDFISKDYWLKTAIDMRDVYLPLCDAIVVFANDDSGKAEAFFAFAGEYLAALFVAPSAQGRGIGRRLLRIARRMHPELTLSVYKKNSRAVAFYQREGMRIVGERVEKATGCEELLMSF